MVDFKAFSDELLKISSSRFAQYVRRASPKDAANALKRMFRVEGAVPPIHVSDPRSLDAVTREKVLKTLRETVKAEVPEVAPRGSAAWRQAMSDIKHGRMVTHESGYPRKEVAESIKRYGGSGDFVNLTPWKDDPTAVKQWYKQRARAELAVPLEASGKLRGGVWTSREGSPTTAMYAKRQGEAAAYGAAESPTKLTFQVPESLSGLTGKSERAYVPNSVFKEWARKVRVDPVK